MRYLPNAPSEDRALLDAIGVQRAEDLLKGIPEPLRLDRELALPTQQSELEVLRALQGMSEKNTAFKASFLGAGAYPHFVPAAIDMMSGRQEWFTAYTPYQPEISQGTLQHIFEYQTIMCDLTGQEVSNASMYDGATSCVEAALMSVRIQRKRKTILISAALHPHYQEVLCTNITPHEDLKLVQVAVKDGVTDLEDLKAKLNADVACFLVGYPNFLGNVEDLKAIGELVKGAGAHTISVTMEALSLGWVEAPGKLGADMSCGEAMSFGNYVSFGGPFLGFLCVKDGFKREIPGRLVGQTVDLEGRPGYVLTLASREQHIRRDKATSNICTNSGLCTLAFTIHMSLLGETGLRKMALLNHEKALATRDALAAIPGVEVLTPRFFNEFAVRLPKPAAEVVEQLAQHRILAGVPYSRLAPDAGMDDVLLVAATEMTMDGDIKILASALAKVCA